MPWAVALTAAFIAPSFALPPEPEGAAGNVEWTFVDSLATCPAGDSVVVGHPAVLRNLITYLDGTGQPRNGVPPESIWVTIKQPTSGAKAYLNDAMSASDGYKWKVFADDSTRSDGTTRLTVSGFSRRDA